MPVQRKYVIGTDLDASMGYAQFEVGRTLSELNTRMYRQGKMYRARLHTTAEALAEAGGLELEVFVLSNNWFNRGAWRAAYDSYRKATKDERAALRGSQIALWEDFKVDHGLGSNFKRLDAGVSATPGTQQPIYLDGGDHNLSKVTQEVGGVTYQYAWNPTGTGSSLSIPLEFAKSGYDFESASPEQNTFDVGYSTLFVDENATQSQNLQARGALPPYDPSTYPPVWVKVGSLGSQEFASLQSNVSSRLSTDYFDALCGLVAIRALGTGGLTTFVTTNDLMLEVAPGNYKGVHAEDI